MSTEETSVKLGANTQEINEKIPEAANKVESAFDRLVAVITKTSAESVSATKGMQSEISGHFSQIGAAINKVTGVFVAVTAIVAGGKVFKDVATETMKWTGEAVKLSKALAISTEQASVLNLALGDTYNSMETALGATTMLTRTLRTNEDAFKKLGVETRDQNGHYRNSLDLMTDVNDRLRHIKEGTDRNIAGMSIYSRQWNEAKGLLRLNAEAMEEAKKKAEELHLIVGPEGVKQLKAYKAAQNDIEDVLLSLKVQIGNAVLPILVRLGAWFGSVGPEAIEIFKGALNGVITFIMYVGLGAVTVFEMLKAQVGALIAITTAGASALGKLVKGDISGAAADMKAGFAEAGDIGEKALDKIGEAANRTNDSMLKLWGLRKSNLPEKKEQPEGETFEGAKKEEPKSRLPDWKAELDQMKLAEDAFLASSKRDDLAFWEEKRKHLKMSKEERQAVDHEILVLKKEIQREDLQNDIEGIKLRMEAEKKGSADRVTIWEEAVKKIGAAYGVDSKEYKAALLEKTKLAKDHEQLLVHLADSVTEKNREVSRIGIEIERDKANHLREIGAIDAEEELQLLRKLEERKAGIEIAALNERLGRERKGTLEYQKVLNEIEIAQAKHAQVMHQIDLRTAREQGQTFQTVYSTMERSFSGAIQGMLTKSMTFAQAMRQISGAILNSFIDLGVKMLFDWVKKQIMMTTVTQAQEAARTGVAAAGETTRSGLAVAGATVQVGANATAAAAGAAASQAPIPIVGPMLAGIAMAAMLALVLGLSSGMKSAAGGWSQIPEDQIAQVHKDEMILPAELAEGVRSSIGKGQQPVARGGDTFHISAVDGKSVKRLLHSHGADVANAVTRQARNFKPIKGKG